MRSVRGTGVERIRIPCVEWASVRCSSRAFNAFKLPSPQNATATTLTLPNRALVLLSVSQWLRGLLSVDRRSRVLLFAGLAAMRAAHQHAGSQSGTGATVSTRFSVVQYHSVTPDVLQYHYTGQTRDPNGSGCALWSIRRLGSGGLGSGGTGGGRGAQGGSGGRSVFLRCTSRVQQMQYSSDNTYPPRRGLCN